MLTTNSVEVKLAGNGVCVCVCIYYGKTCFKKANTDGTWRYEVIKSSWNRCHWHYCHRPVNHPCLWHTVLLTAACLCPAVHHCVAAQLLATGVARSVPKPCSAYPHEDKFSWDFTDLTGCSVLSRIFSSSLPRETVDVPFRADIRNVWNYTSTYTVRG